MNSATAFGMIAPAAIKAFGGIVSYIAVKKT